MVDQDLESKKEQKEKDYITVSDPACGAGAMLIAFANCGKRTIAELSAGCIVCGTGY